MPLANLLASVFAAVWTFHSAQLAVQPAMGVERDADVHELRIPSRGSCGWWETRATVVPKGGARIRAVAEIALDDPQDAVFNDMMMFVRWDFPKDGKDRGASGSRLVQGQRFHRRDFIAYADRTEDGRVVRTFDQTCAVPDDCEEVSIEFIGKWHAMTAVIRDVRVESAPRPQPRRVRCVVGNPYERSVDWSDPQKGMAERLGQIEATLTNIFARVERPDIILFSECFASAGAPDPSKVAEPIPGGPSWRLAERYAVRHRCNIAMNVKERDEQGACHNTLFVCDRNGRLAGRYRKVHLTSGEYQQGLVPGEGFPVLDLDFGRVGALICWDNWFSESIKLVKRAGAELLLFPLAGCMQDHVDICFPARAIDAGIPILVAMRQKHLPNGIIDRDGTWIARTFEENGFAVADIDLAERKRVFWLSVGPGLGDPTSLYYDESRPEVYEHIDWRIPRK